jgi:ADP-heptose:LPS heptosyltransferase
VNILVLRALGIGDLATAVPALRGLHAAFPDARIDLAAPAWVAPLARLIDAVDDVVDASSLDHVPADRPDVAVNLHGRGPQSHKALQRTNPGQLIAFQCPSVGFRDGPPWVRPGGDSNEHEVQRWCRMLDWYGIATDPADLALRRPPMPSPAPRATLIHPGAKAASRRWPISRFARVARALENDGHHVVVTGSAGDLRRSERVAAAAGLPRERVLAGRSDVAGLAALVADATLVISGDTGIAHVATAYGVPSVVLFGPVPPAQWGPPASRSQHRAIWYGERPARTAGGVHPALLAITVDDVVLAAKDALEHESVR